MYRNIRTGEVSDPEKIKDFFSYMTPGIRDIENGDIIEEFSIPTPV